MTDTEEKEIAENLIRLRLEKEPDLDSELVRRVFMLSLSQGPLGVASKVPFGEDTLFSAATLLDFVIGEIRFAKLSHPEAALSDSLLSQKALDKFVLLKDADNDSVSPDDATNYYDPEISDMRAMEHFLLVINTPLAHTNPSVSLINDIFETVLRKIAGFCKMMTLGLYADAFVSWRTLHESECILSLLISGGDKTRFSYVRHIAYNNAFRNQSYFTKEELDKTFDVIKNEMRLHDLKSKDMKKFIEYGWLYDHPSFNSQDPTMKLNFRDGLERLANLSRYSKIYEGASEIAHSSSAFFYVNDSFCRDLSLALTYQSFTRIVHLYLDFMKAYFDAKPNDKAKSLVLLKDVEVMSDYLSGKVNLEEFGNDSDEGSEGE
jgi:hypothetical protein